ncbi:DUF302 domain-containing protein [Rhodobacteraceae bacterium RKSG542]|nr:DUF302 domain-containing protein [Pseudovibrio flavus]
MSAPAQADGAMADREGWRSIDTQFTYGELLKNLKNAITQIDMRLVTQASASAGAKAAGVEIPGNAVVGVFRNDYARRMLEASIAAGIEAPIRFYVTENASGTATLSWKTPSFVFQPYEKEGGDALVELGQELDQVFLSIAELATGNM